MTKRAVAGRLNGIFAEPGTLVGPIWTGEFVVALETDLRGTKFGWPTQDELKAARNHAREVGPRSVSEIAVAR
jgi:hypothetical protein